MAIVDLVGTPDEPAFDEPVRPGGFEALHAAAHNELGAAFFLAMDDEPLARRALERSLRSLGGGIRGDRSSSSTPQDLWRVAFTWLTTARWPRSVPDPAGPAVLARSTGRPLADAIVALPVRQRSVIACRHLLGWSAAQTATAHGAPESTVLLRERRALGELSKAAGDEGPLDDAMLHDELAALARPPIGLSDLAMARTQAERRTKRQRLGLIGAALLGIALVGAAIQAVPDDAPVTEAGPQTVDPPRETEHPYVPISDGAGGFVAFGRRGGTITSSADGESWFPMARLNVDRIDLRLFVERFERSDGRYLMLVDSTSGGGQSFSGTDQPRIALSDNLRDWTFLRLDVEPPPPTPGLQPRVDLLSATRLGDRVLVAVRIDQGINHRRLGVVEHDVCTTTDDAAGLVLHLCDGDQVVVAEADSLRSGPSDDIRLYASDGGAEFERIAIDDRFNPWGLFTFEDRFAMLDPSASELLVSDDGTEWVPFFELGIDNRLGLASGTPDGAMVIAPDTTAWRSTLLRDSESVSGRLPVSMDPATIWIKPELVAGPAGWALFVTTSRPWERSNPGVDGWALQTGEWIVEQRPERESIRLRSTVDDLTYEYHRGIEDGEVVVDHPTVTRTADGDVGLDHPVTGERLVDVSGEEILAAWLTGGAAEQREDDAAAPTRAFVVFSPDGVNWEIVWETTRNTWYGSVAVGDDEVLVASSALSGGPERVPVGDNE